MGNGVVGELYDNGISNVLLKLHLQGWGAGLFGEP